MILSIKNFHLEMILTIVNFQVHDFDLQAMDGGRDGTAKNLDPYLSSDHI